MVCLIIMRVLEPVFHWQIKSDSLIYLPDKLSFLVPGLEYQILGEKVSLKVSSDSIRLADMVVI